MRPVPQVDVIAGRPTVVAPVEAGEAGALHAAVTVTAEGIAVEAGGRTMPPHVVATRRCTLPRDISTFTDRDAELQQLVQLVHDSRGQTAPPVCVIDGMPGVGKTAFAVHAAHLLAPQFPDGQLFVDFRSHTAGLRPVAPASALEAVLEAWGIPPADIPRTLDKRADLWRRCTADRNVLLVFDDVPADHGAWEPLIPGGGGCLVLVTSRRRQANLAGVNTLAMKTMPSDEAAKLVLRISRLDRPDQAAPLTELCGGVPLVLSLAAGRVRSHPARSVDQVAEDLRRNLGRFGGPGVENAVMAASIDLSYRDLGREQRRLFRTLGEHPGAEFDAYAAAAAAGVDVETAAAGLDALYNDCLLEEPAPYRYQAHDLIRSHARNRTHPIPGSRRAALRRILDYYVTVATLSARQLGAAFDPIRVGRPASIPDVSSPAAATEWLETERSNLADCVAIATAKAWGAHATGIAAATHEFFRNRGYWDQAATIQENAAAAARAAHDSVHEAAALAALGTIRRSQGDFTAAEAPLATAEQLYRHRDDRHALAGVLTESAALHQMVGRYPDATAALNEAAELYRALGDHAGRAHAQTQLGAILYLTGRNQESIAMLEDALAAAESTHDQLGTANALTQLGAARRKIGDYEGAAGALDRALTAYRALGSSPGLANGWMNLGGLHLQQNDVRAAAEAYTQALKAYTTIGNRLGQTNVLINLGELHRMLGDLDAAAAELEQARSNGIAMGSPLAAAEASTNLGSVLCDQGRYPEALDALSRALETFAELEDQPGVAEVFSIIASTHLATGRHDEATTAINSALEILVDLDEPDALTKARNVHDAIERAKEPPAANESLPT